MKTKQPELNKITALYERLSRDDEQSGDSTTFARMISVICFWLTIRLSETVG